MNDGSLVLFAESNRLDPAKLVIDSGLLVLPRNAELPTKTTDIDVFPNTTKDLLAEFADCGFCAELYGEAAKRRALVRKSADVLLPVLLFAGSAAVSLGLNIVANWICDRWVRKEESPPSIRVEYAELAEGGKVVRWRRAEGPVDEVCKLLRQEAQAVPDSTNRLASGQKTDSHWWKDHCQTKANAAISTARELISEGERQLSEGNRRAAEQLQRRALARLREAALWEPRQAEHRIYLHTIGKRIHDAFGCNVSCREGAYWVECPVALSHSRGGFSVGGTGRTICSICGEEMLNCPHVKGREYDAITATRIFGERCNICGERQCGHNLGETYDHVRAFGTVTEMEIEEISFVENPANPLAAVHGYSLTRADIITMLPEEERDSFEYGSTTVHCHHCKVCNGL